MSERILIRNARLIDPANGRDEQGSVAIDGGRIAIVGSGEGGAARLRDFDAARTIDARGAVVAPGLVDLAARLGEPGHEHAGLLESELAAAVAGGVTSVVCPPDTDPVLDEPGLVEMLKFRARNLDLAHLYPLGALTQGLKGEELTEMAELTEAGCVGFAQADVAIRDTLVLHRALQYAATFGYAVWLRPNDAWLGNGVAAKGPLATRLGLSGVPVLAETIALATIFELVRDTGARVHLCRLSSAAGVDLVRKAKAERLPVTCDASIHQLHLIDVDMGYFDSAMRLVTVCWRRVSSWISTSPLAPASPRAGSARPGSGASAASPSGSAFGFAAAPSPAAASTSALTIRPPGPEPSSRASSTPSSSAILRATGEALTRPPSPAPLVEAGLGLGLSFAFSFVAVAACFFSGSGSASASPASAAGSSPLSAFASELSSPPLFTSPASPMRAITSPMANVSPSLATISTSTPSESAS